MRGWDAARIAHAAGGRLIAAPSPVAGEPGPRRAVIDSREVGPGDLFVGLRGAHRDGGAYAAKALAAGAWGVLVGPGHAEQTLASALAGLGGAVLVHPDPLVGLQALARAWRGELGEAGAKVVAVTGSTGKTSTKDILAALLAGSGSGGGATGGGRVVGSSSAARATGLRTMASPENLNTEIGLPLAVLAAPTGTEALVLEMAMRGAGQIAELATIAKPDVGVIVNIGPVHLELLGSLEAIAAAKGELIAGLGPGATAVIPAHEPLLEPHRRTDVRTITFGEGGDVELVERRPDGDVMIAAGTERLGLRPSFAQPHNLSNLLAAVAAARALGVTPEGSVEVRFSALRGERIALPGGIVLVNDCYNANPMSMRAAIDDLSETAPARRLAVLGDMLELGRKAGPGLHREVAEHAAGRGVDVLVTVGPLAAEMAGAFGGGDVHSVPDSEAAAELLGGLLREGDTVLVKGSRGVGLERVAQALLAEAHAGQPVSARSVGRR